MVTENLEWAPYGNRADGEVNTPNPTQEKILDWVDSIRATPLDEQDHIPVLFLQGGVGSGKTSGLMAPVGEMLFEIPGLRVLWGRQDFNDLKMSVMDKFFERLPSAMIEKKNEQYHWYDIKTGKKTPPSRIFFNGLKDLSGLGSQEFGIIIITEVHETSEQAYRTLKRRCRQAGMPVMILMEGEPPNEGHWLTRLTDKTKEEYDPDIEKWELSTYENWDNLPTAYKGSLESMPDVWKRRYLMGKPGFTPKGRPFYEGFKEPIHTGWFDWNPHEPLIVSWDFGYHHPAISCHQINQRWYVLRELMGSNTTIRKFASNEVKPFLNRNFPNAQIINFGDPASKATNDQTEKTSWQVCKEEGFTLRVRGSDYRMRKEIIDQKMSNLVNGKPFLQVDTRCKTIIEGFLGGYCYAEENANKEINSKYELPFHDNFYSHLMNTVEYVAVNNFKAISRHTSKETIDRQNKFKYRQPVQNAGFGFSGGKS